MEFKNGGSVADKEPYTLSTVCGKLLLYQAHVRCHSVSRLAGPTFGAISTHARHASGLTRSDSGSTAYWAQRQSCSAAGFPHDCSSPPGSLTCRQ